MADELSPRARTVLERYRTSTEPSDRSVERAATRVLVHERVDARDRAHRRRRRRVRMLAFAAAVVVAVAGGWGAWSMVQRQAPDPGRVQSSFESARDVAHGASAAGRAPGAPAGPPSSPVVSPPVEPLAPVGEVPVASGVAGQPSPNAPRPAARAFAEAPDLALESALLSRARAAMTAQRWSEARALARSHARRFPGGFLAEERLVIEAVARCRSGDERAGRTSARELMRRFPGSPAVPEVAAACEIPP
jgi:hypothetical protein